MSIQNMFSKERVTFSLKSKTKMDVLDELIDILASDGKVSDMFSFKEAVLKREEEFSTGIGSGIAIPHGKSASVKEASIVFGKSSEGIDFDSLDEKPAYLFFLIAVPVKSDDIHLKALSEISRKLMHDEVKRDLMNCTNYEDFIKIFK